MTQNRASGKAALTTPAPMVTVRVEPWLTRTIRPTWNWLTVTSTFSSRSGSRPTTVAAGIHSKPPCHCVSM